MTVQNINVEEAIERVKALIASEQNMSPALKSSLEVMMLLVSILAERVGRSSRNSSLPPSQDQNREKKTRAPGVRKPGGQLGRAGKTLAPIPDPDEIVVLSVDRRTLPAGTYREVGCETRQVIDLDLSREVTEYQAQILEDQHGNRFVAMFPERVTRPVQYGSGVKVHAVYLSQYQLLPYNRVEEHFQEQLQVSISSGTLFAFNQEAYERLEAFEQWNKNVLAAAGLLHVDETGINIGGKRNWLHVVSTDRSTYYFPHAKRGTEAMDAMAILPTFAGTLCHDHWKPYFTYGGKHALCNAHHLRELEGAFEHDKQQWARMMSELLKEINRAVHDAGGVLPSERSRRYREQYRALLAEADVECPGPPETKQPGKRGRVARSKARNLLERLRDHEDDALRFMDEPDVPFSNNQAENDIRMTKVQQKISGCFRSWDGALIFCRIRGYLSTCRKRGIFASEALRLLFEGKSPSFMTQGAE